MNVENFILPSFYEIKSWPVCLVLPDFCQFGFKNEPAGYWPDRTGQNFEPAGPDRS
jgi:hypothetical protein